MKSVKTPPFLSQSRRNGVPKPSKETWPFGKDLSNLNSVIIKISTITLSYGSTLFRTELIFRCTKISFLRLPLRKVFKLKFTLEFDFSRVSDR